MVREFIDRQREVAVEFSKMYEMGKINRKKLLYLVEKDPYFFDPYIELYLRAKRGGKLKRAQKYVDDGYEKAIELICDEKSNWPDVMEWGFLENRHIIKMLMTKGLELWEEEKTNEALETFRNLLKTCPNDNVGARDYILAIRLGWNYDKFNKELIDESGKFYNTEAMFKFQKKYDDFPDEFDWWKKAVGYE